MAMRASNLMRAKPITVRPDASLLDVLHLFVEAQIGGAPVVDDEGTVHGIVTTADLLAAVDQMYDEDVDAGEDPEQAGADLGRLTVRDIASPELVWATPEETVQAIAQRMREEGVHRVLVGEDGRMLGILTAFDLLQAMP
jgi:CBS domain-containing protein